MRFKLIPYTSRVGMTSFLGEWLDTWLHDYKKPEVRATTFDTYETLIRRHLKPALGHILPKDLRPEHLQRFYNNKVQSGSCVTGARNGGCGATRCRTESPC